MKKLSLIIFAVFLCAFPTTAQTGVEALTQKATRLTGEGKLDEALIEINRALAIAPNRAGLYLQRAGIYQLAKNVRALVEDVNKAVGIEPLNERNVLLGARYLSTVGQYPQELAILNAFILKIPTSGEAYYARSQARWRLGDITGAFDDILTAIELNPNKTTYYSSRLVFFLQICDSKSDLEIFKRVVAFLEDISATAKTENDRTILKRDLTKIYLSRAGIFENNKDIDSLIADLTRAVELTPADYIFRRRAQVYHKNLRFAEAVADYTEAIRVSENAFGLYLERGDVLLDAEKYDEALLDYEQALNLTRQFKSFVEKKIDLVKEKMQAGENRLK